MDSKPEEQLNYSATQFGVLKGHTGWVTKICISPTDPDTLITASRDKTVLLWKLYAKDGEMSGKLKKSLLGHNHFVSDCCISKDGGFLITCSWDKTIRLWDINRGSTKLTFRGHTNDVTSVAFSMDNRQIVSGSRDTTVRLWNTLAVQKFVFEEEGHKDCVSSVLTTPQSSSISIMSAGWDKVVKIWSLTPTRCLRTIYGHSNAINSMSVCPDGTLLATGSKDTTINVWNINESKLNNKFNAGGVVNSVSFNPRFFLMAAAVGSTIQLYNLNTNLVYQTVIPVDLDNPKTLPTVISLSWSNDGTFLFAGYSDCKVRIFCLRPQSAC
ncbi:hypothetical protein HZS_4257 [Henneguya salminicola]|nr:hypothetical protein HZS_4257 [Henneguya salminicola]